MNTHLRNASVAAILTLALSSAAGAASVKLVPLKGQTVATSLRSCSVPSAPAAVTYAEPADLPAIAAGQGVTGITEVRITLDAHGQLVDKAVFGSSGNKWIDRAALQSAASSQYSAEIQDCQRVGGMYGFVVDFTQ